MFIYGGEWPLCLQGNISCYLLIFFLLCVCVCGVVVWTVFTGNIVDTYRVRFNLCRNHLFIKDDSRQNSQDPNTGAPVYVNMGRT